MCSTSIGQSMKMTNLSSPPNNNDYEDIDSEVLAPILTEKEKKRPSLLTKVLNEYSNNSTIHGVRYITEFRKSKIDKYVLSG